MCENKNTNVINIQAYFGFQFMYKIIIVINFLQKTIIYC